MILLLLGQGHGQVVGDLVTLCDKSNVSKTKDIITGFKKSPPHPLSPVITTNILVLLLMVNRVLSPVMTIPLRQLFLRKRKSFHVSSKMRETLSKSFH